MAKNILNASSMLERITDYKSPLRVFECVVPEIWTDFNGHMNETHYLECFSNASDAVMQLVGCDEAYIAAGKSYFTVETHICHLDEAKIGEKVFATTQVLQAQGKKLHLFHLLFSESPEEKRLLASGEQMLLHVDLASRKSCNVAGELAHKLQQLAQDQSEIPWPQGAGRAIGVGK